jgi:hypothetical protein
MSTKSSTEQIASVSKATVVVVAKRHAWLVALIKAFKTDFEESAETQAKIHRAFTYIWLVNIIAVTVLFFALPGFWAQFSLYYLVMVSLYANFSTDYGALSAAQASGKASEALDKLTDVVEDAGEVLEAARED